MADRALRVVITGDARGAEKALRSVQGQADTTGRKFDRLATRIGASMTRTGRALTLGLTVPIVSGAVLAVKAAAEEEQQMRLLAKVIEENVVGATDEMVASNEEWITSMQDATGVADGELRDAMRHLIISGMDVAEAQDALTTAMDIAAAKGLDLEAVAVAISKAQNGNVGALGRLGIATRDAEGDMLTFEAAMALAAETMGGSAVEAAETAAGRTARMAAKFEDLKETIGTILLPVLEDLTAMLTTVVDWFKSLSPQTQRWIVKIGAVVAAIGPLLIIGGKLVTWAAKAKAGFIAIKTAMMAVQASSLLMLGVWGLVIAGVIALVIVVVKNWDKIKAAVKAAWEKIKEWTGAAARWVKERWQGILEWFRNLPGGIKLALAGLAAIITAPFLVPIAAVKAAIEGLKWAWQSLMDLINGSSKGFSGPAPPKGGAPPGATGVTAMARGGIIMPRRMGRLFRGGEAGSPEAVVPLNQQGAQFIRNALAGVGGGSQVIQFVVNGRIMEEMYVQGKALADRKGR